MKSVFYLLSKSTESTKGYEHFSLLSTAPNTKGRTGIYSYPFDAFSEKNETPEHRWDYSSLSTIIQSIKMEMLLNENIDDYVKSILMSIYIS